MMLVGITHRSLAAKFFIRFVVSVQPVLAATLYPCRSRLDTEMVILFPCQSALSVGAFQNPLRQRHRCRNTVPAHLLHRKPGVSLCIFLILTHYYIGICFSYALHITSVVSDAVHSQWGCPMRTPAHGAVYRIFLLSFPTVPVWAGACPNPN